MEFKNLDLKDKIRIGFGISLIVLLLSTILSFYSILQLIQQSGRVDHSNEVMINLEQLFSIMKDSETSQRGFLLTSKEEFLDNYKGGYEKVLTYYNKLKFMTSDNPSQTKNLADLKIYIDKRYKKFDSVITKFKNQKYNIDAEELIEGKKIMDECRLIIQQIQEEEQRLLGMRAYETRKYSNYSRTVILISAMLAIAIAFISFYYINRDIHKRTVIQKELDEKNYELLAVGKLNDLLRGERNLPKACKKIIQHLLEYTNSEAGLFYLLKENGKYDLSCSIGITEEDNVVASFEPNSGLLGRVATERNEILLQDISSHSLKIKSGIVESTPAEVLIIPFYMTNETIAVAEILSRTSFKKKDLNYVRGLGNIISIFINNLNAELKTQELLAETQTQAEELSSQQEEMKYLYEELKTHRDQLQASEEELKVSEEELQEKNAELELQYESIRNKNITLEEARNAIQLKIKEVEKVSKYKSEFLSNMSHELRTPLNSILILSSLLKENKEGRLTKREVEQAAVIERSGNDLLSLINEILDLARIESGKIKIESKECELSDFKMNDHFEYLAKQKSIAFHLFIDPDLPPTIVTDKFRVEQILKNLLSNAFKFTPPHGTVEYKMMTSQKLGKFDNDFFDSDGVCFVVKDSGIGIAKEKKDLIFEGFQQADPSTTRKFGGTGLGLTISRELATLLGGKIKVESEEGKGSVFVLFIPFQFEMNQSDPTQQDEDPFQNFTLPDGSIDSLEHLEKDAAIYKPETRREVVNGNNILIVEDDVYFSNILSDYAKQKGFDVYVTSKGEEVITMAMKYHPIAILLDVQLPDVNGWEILRRIKNNNAIKNISVHMMSAYDMGGSINQLGQDNFLAKPINLEILDSAFAQINARIEKDLKQILVVEDNVVENDAIRELLKFQNVETIGVYTGEEAVKTLQRNYFDCIILDIRLPDINGFELLKKIRLEENTRNIPVIIYSGKELSEEEEIKFKKYTNVIIIKTEHSYTRLLEEVKLFLHHMGSSIESEKNEFKALETEHILKNKKILIVDDDMRNIFSLTSFLEDQGVSVVGAFNGRQAIEELMNDDTIDLVLMDMMMPELDGIEATKIIRNNLKFKNLPIIALTAKAMPGDRESCIKAGVSDYISKPIDLNKLLSLLRVWIYKS